MNLFLRILILTVAAAALAAPAAQADPWYADRTAPAVDSSYPPDAVDRAIASAKLASAKRDSHERDVFRPTAQQLQPLLVTTGGFDWSAALVGAAGMLGIVVMVAGGLALTGRQTRLTAS